MVILLVAVYIEDERDRFEPDTALISRRPSGRVGL
jgi:hypothetical protein